MRRPLGSSLLPLHVMAALALLIPFACSASPKPKGPRLPQPPAVVEVTFTGEITLWVQDLVHSGRDIYGLFHHFGDPRLPGLWRANIDTGEFAVLRFVSAPSECRLPLNAFTIGPDGLSAVFFCPPGCDPTPCLSGQVHDGPEPLMSYRGSIEADWQPAVVRGASGSVEGWRYFMDEVEQPQGDTPGRFVLTRTEKRVRGRD